ncbi:Pimeloyl-ACP methyl ester carboxylesterase [Tistlia consotensis]|uniref:Pimeloyl-ACP methyl ester carboxylesterase n=1 Tax=Tistlia consotensis USBA 355 TaxID=560819 RepID=A0A1Y6C2F1_9PROT|nr:alpha/beta hydrolase [Tistlia consotensis]SMF33108.1 Pimeloyl-ACP methyl ester carboxylesterase [Tistlia consotensis USBA 355]SNR69351.1 Pimeloyl-ACP methyl ester carboxylesterase [Tistlia consotensis]
MELTVDGRRAFAATGGQAFDAARVQEGRPVFLLVHGAGMDRTVWAAQSRYLAHHGRAVLAVDLPGHGRSEGPPLASIGAIADWLVRLLDAAGVRQAALVGHSMGAIACLAAAARHPERVRALGLCGCAAAMPVHPDLLAAAAADDHAAIDMINAWAHGEASHRGGHPQPGTWLIGGGNRLLERAASGVLSADLQACAGFAEGEALAARVGCPTVVVVGEDDRMTPAKAGRRLAAAIPGASVAAIPDCGHMMMTEKPRETLAALLTLA